MRRFVFLVLLCLAPISAAQELVVDKFELLPTDLTAKIANKKDLNGDVCALVKIYIAVPTISVPDDMILGGVEKANYSEFWAFMPAGSRRIQVNAPGYLPLKYAFPEPLAVMRTYELRVSVPERSSGPVLPELTTNFLALTFSPKDATVLVDNMPRSCQDGTLALELAFGVHSYQISAPMYHTRKGEFTISDAGTTELTVDLDPAFGHLKVISLPDDAQVLVNGEVRGKTPCTLRLASDRYTLQLVKSGYLAHSQEVVVADSRTEELRVALTANFSEVTLRSPLAGAEIWVSGRKVGVGSWTGNLDAGAYTVESRCAGYESVSDNIEVDPATPRTYALTAPVPVYGILKVTSTPMGATMKLDSEIIGKTPFLSNRILTGSHRLSVELDGYRPVEQTVTIIRDKAAEWTAELTKGYKVGDYYNENGKEGVVFEVDATGLHGKIIALADAPKKMDWSEAKIYCEFLGDGWRLPTKEELLKIYEQKSRINKGLREKAVLDSGWYWSSTESSNDWYAWGVFMYDGTAYGNSKGNDDYVRAVSAF